MYEFLSREDTRNKYKVLKGPSWWSLILTRNWRANFNLAPFAPIFKFIIYKLNNNKQLQWVKPSSHTNAKKQTAKSETVQRQLNK